MRRRRRRRRRRRAVGAWCSSPLLWRPSGGGQVCLCSADECVCVSDECLCVFVDPLELVGCPERSQYMVSTKEMMQPCLIYLHAISLVAHPLELAGCPERSQVGDRRACRRRSQCAAASVPKLSVAGAPLHPIENTFGSAHMPFSLVSQQIVRIEESEGAGVCLASCDLRPFQSAGPASRWPAPPHLGRPGRHQGAGGSG